MNAESEGFPLGLTSDMTPPLEDIQLSIEACVLGDES